MDLYDPSGVAELASWTPLRSTSFPSLHERQGPRQKLPAHADNWLWRDPTPAIPQPWPVELQLDRRSWRPGSAALSPQQAGGHRRTGAIDHPAWVRSSHFVHPGRDVAYQTYKAAHLRLEADRRMGQRSQPPIPAHAEMYRAFADLFWTLGNPPLLGQMASRALFAALVDAELLDASHRPTRPIGEAQLAAIVAGLDVVQRSAGPDFARYGAIALNVIYDLCKFGAAQTALCIYCFRPRKEAAEGTSYDAWSHHPQREVERDDVRRRSLEVSEMFARCAKDLRHELIEEAICAARLTDPGLAPPTQAERERQARVNALLSLPELVGEDRADDR